MSEPTLNYVLCPDASGGHRMAYWQWGDAQSPHVVVCVHGLSRQARDFDVLARSLCERSGGHVRVICPDVVGRGHSDWLKDPMGYQVPLYAADMLTLLAALEPQTLDWVGTSMGGLIGIAVCGLQEAQSAASLGAAAAPGRPKQGTAPVGLTSTAPSLPAQTWTDGRVVASGIDMSSAAHAVASVGAVVPVRRLVLNDVGPRIQWQALRRIGEYLGDTGRFESIEQAADAMWAASTTFGPHSPAQWLALSRPMVKPVPGLPGVLTLHYDPAIALTFQSATPESVAQGEATLWQLYDQITASTLLLRGAQSDLLSVETAQSMTRRGPQARLVEFDGIGHAPTLIADDQVQVVTSFLLQD